MMSEYRDNKEMTDVSVLNDIDRKIEKSSHLCTEISKICCNGPAELRFVSLMSRHG